MTLLAAAHLSNHNAQNIPLWQLEHAADKGAFAYESTLWVDQYQINKQ